MVSTVISAFNSLPLSPAHAAILLKSHHAKKDWLTALMDNGQNAWLALSAINWSFDIWHVDDRGYDIQHWKKALFNFAQRIFKSEKK